MILAGIDIGTNSFRLLIVEAGAGTFREIHSERAVPRLGQRLVRGGALSREAWDRSLVALRTFAEAIRVHGVQAVSAVGTSALRDAADARAFTDRVRQETGISIVVVSGQEEARLTARGVLYALSASGRAVPDPDAASLLIDIGGGSAELIALRTGDVPETASLPLGAVGLTERFLHSDPVTGEELARLQRTIREELTRSPVPITPATALIGTAGAITTLAAMDQRMAVYDPSAITGSVLQRTAIDRMVEDLRMRTVQERRSLPGLETGREDIILAGAVVVQEIMALADVPSLVVSDGGVREGIVLDLAERTADRVPGPTTAGGKELRHA